MPGAVIDVIITWAETKILSPSSEQLKACSDVLSDALSGEGHISHYNQFNVFFIIEIYNREALTVLCSDVKHLGSGYTSTLLSNLL